MIARLKWSRCFFATIAILSASFSISTNAYAQGLENCLTWNIETSKETVFSGEPIITTLKIKNTGPREVAIYFGTGGIEAFSMAICDSSNKVVAQGGHIQRSGFILGSSSVLVVPSGKTSEKSIVLNQWCSTLLPPGQYRVACRVRYGLGADRQEALACGTVKTNLLLETKQEFDIHIVKMDDSKLKKILEGLGRRATRRNPQTMEEVTDRKLSREALCYAESEHAVVYQTWLLRISRSTWQKRDVINSLVRSETLEAAQGLMETLEDRFIYKEDIKGEIIDAVYRLRETEKSDILNSTNDFVARYRRPVLDKPTD